MRLSDLSGADAAKYRDDRLSKVKPATIRRELVVLRHIFEVARSEWNIPLHSNPVHALKLPKDSRPRDRRLEADEAGKLLDALGKRTAWYLRPLLLLAIETGMPRGELLSVRWRDVDLRSRTIRLLRTRAVNPAWSPSPL